MTVYEDILLLLIGLYPCFPPLENIRKVEIFSFLFIIASVVPRRVKDTWLINVVQGNNYRLNDWYGVNNTAVWKKKGTYCAGMLSQVRFFQYGQGFDSK